MKSDNYYICIYTCFDFNVAGELASISDSFAAFCVIIPVKPKKLGVLCGWRIRECKEYFVDKNAFGEFQHNIGTAQQHRIPFPTYGTALHQDAFRELQFKGSFGIGIKLRSKRKRGSYFIIRDRR
ncbi:hypothetical protein SDC9_93252 [bioreactor metagenome]|uniref:Uncharacterized protein n=1 Tax=bioreactor metagenome TaxID=1076179 RepID=A0A645A1D0_9ZZZZ